MKRSLALLLALVMVLALLSGCSGGGKTAPTAAPTQAPDTTLAPTQAPAPTEAPQPTAEPAPTEAPAPTLEPQPATRTVTDMKGNVVEIPYEVHTYVESWFAHNAVDLMLDRAEGMLITCANTNTHQWMYIVCPNFWNAQSTTFSTDMSLEEIIAAGPDVVFGSNENYREMFENVGIPFINCSFNTYETLIQSIRLTAEVFGGEALAIAEDYVDYLSERLDFVSSRVSGIPDEERTTVAHGSSVYELDFDGANTIIDQWITYAGGINAAAEGLEGNLQTISIEQVMEWDPDVLITGRPQSQVDEIMADPVWANLKAVKNGRVYANPRGIFAWDRYGVEAALQPQWCAKLLYPDLFEDFDIREELKNFYRRFLGYELSDNQAQMILNYETPELDMESRIITDLNGNEVEVPIPVKTISTGKLNLTQLTLILAGSDAVANLGDGADASKGTLLNAMFPELEGMTVLTESNMDAEALLLVEPDLVMIYTRSTELGGNLQNAGFPVAYCNLGNEEELLRTMKIMSAALGGGAPMQAARYETFYRQLMADVAEKSAGLAEENKPLVAYLRGNGAVCGVNSMPNNWIAAAGGVNIGALAGFPQYAAEMSAEDLIMYDPDIIFCESAQTLEFLDNDAYKNLKAVKNGALYIVPYGLSCSGLANAENPLVWQWAANIIQPDIYDYDAEQTIRDFFLDFYGYELSDTQLDTILHR